MGKLEGETRWMRGRAYAIQLARDVAVGIDDGVFTADLGDFTHDHNIPADV